jgi:1,4-dihydroxy-2-naphthoate octaprenyltransferase
VASGREWVQGARPRTLPAAIAPVLVGTGVAAYQWRINWLNAVLALLVALALQVGVNYANDYSDGIRGTDEVRVGPVRLVGQHLAAAKSVRLAAFGAFALAALGGVVLVLFTQAWWLLAVGALAILAAWFYTGGPRPYGYVGLGEVFVFVFFGVVATAGTAYVQLGALTWLALVLSCGVGLLSVAILVANNLRDIPGDTQSGKHTLAVRLGDAGTRRLYLACLLGAYAVAAGAGVLGLVARHQSGAILGPGGGNALGSLELQQHSQLSIAYYAWSWGAFAALLSVPLAAPMIRVIRSGAKGRDLIPVLAGTGRLLLVYAIVLTAGLITSAWVEHAVF